MVISVASGKGGTGKTTVSASLAWVAALMGPVQLLDCDVEDPDAHFYIKPDWEQEQEVTTAVPAIDKSCCDGCGSCAEFCEFNALAVVGDDVLVFEDICHSCSGCAVACPLNCIEMAPRRTGIMREGNRGNIHISQGLLDIGRAISVPIIRELRKNRSLDLPTIIDCPPGTGCPMIHSVSDTDYCLLVTESSPFGKHDLDLAHKVSLELGVPHGVLINKSSGSDGLIEDYCENEKIPVLGKIPYLRRIAELCSRGDILAEVDHVWRDNFIEILKVVGEACCISLQS